MKEWLEKAKKWCGIGKKDEKKALYLTLIIIGAVVLLAGTAFVVFKFLVPAKDEPFEDEEDYFEPEP